MNYVEYWVCCRAAKVGKDGLSPIEMVITVDKVRSFRRLSIKVEPNEYKRSANQ